MPDSRSSVDKKWFDIVEYHMTPAAAAAAHGLGAPTARKWPGRSAAFGTTAQLRRHTQRALAPHGEGPYLFDGLVEGCIELGLTIIPRGAAPTTPAGPSR